jgi:hypothetical protein
MINWLNILLILLSPVAVYVVVYCGARGFFNARFAAALSYGRRVETFRGALDHEDEKEEA